MSNPQWLATADWQKEIEAVRQVGDWIRLPVNWDELQPSATTPVASWNWSTYDQIIDRARLATTKPLKVLVILGATPGWANGSGGYGKPATNAADYQNYCRQVAYRYLAKGVTAYQVGNEINLPHPGWTQNAADYYNGFMVPASAGLQQAAVDRSTACQVVMGSLAPNTWSTSPHPHDFLVGIYQAAGGNATGNGKWRWNALSYHPYVNPDNTLLPSVQANLKDIPPQLYADMVTYQEGTKKLWGTEFGSPTHGSYVITEATQASWVDNVVDKWNSYSYAGPLFWYTARDKKAYGASTDREDYFGLLYHDFSAKPAYPLLKSRFSPAIANGTYRITARHSGLALDAEAWGTANGTRVQQWAWHGGNSQRWTVELQSDGYCEIKANTGPGLNLDLNAGSSANGTKTQLWSDNNSNAQRFKFESLGGGYYRITPKVNTASCLDVFEVSTSSGADVIEWTWSGANNQQWQVVPVF